VGAVPRRERQMELFREALEECYLSDLGYKGPSFTWTNGQEGEGFVKARLDRAVANRGWCELYQLVDVCVLAARSLDHKPLVVQMGGEVEERVVFSKSFKVESSWMVDTEYKQMVDEAWMSGGCGGTKLSLVQQKLANCQAELSSWSSRKFGSFLKS
jgi:hypothetical protein